MSERSRSGLAMRSSVTSESFEVEREILTTCSLSAPRELAFKVWTEREHLEKWWGPDGFTTTTYEMNVQPGGAWQFDLIGPDGVAYRNRIIFDEIRSPERLVYRHVSGPRFHVTVLFSAVDGMTEITMRMRFESAAEYELAIEKFGAVEGARQTFRRMIGEVETLLNPDR